MKLVCSCCNFYFLFYLLFFFVNDIKRDSPWGKEAWIMLSNGKEDNKRILKCISNNTTINERKNKQQKKNCINKVLNNFYSYQKTWERSSQSVHGSETKNRKCIIRVAQKLDREKFFNVSDSGEFNFH